MKDLFGKQRDQLKEMQTSLVEVEHGIRDHDSVPADQTAGNRCETPTEEPETETDGEAGSAEAEQAPELVLQMTGISN